MRKISEEIRTISPYKRQDLLRYGHSDPRLSVSFQSQTRWMAGEWKSWLKLTPLLDFLSLSLSLSPTTLALLALANSLFLSLLLAPFLLWIARFSFISSVSLHSALTNIFGHCMVLKTYLQKIVFANRTMFQFQNTTVF